MMHTTPAFAEDKKSDSNVAFKGVVTNITKGQSAPFTGILLSNEAAAKLYGDLNFFEQECKLTLSKELDIQRLKFKTDLDVFKLKLEVETERTEKLLAIKNERIEFLEKNWKPQPWYETGEFWMAVGLVVGISLTVGTTYAVNQASK